MIYDINYTYKEIADAIGGELTGKNGYINGLSINSKEKSESHFCFFAIKGKKCDGADYIEEAIKNGASLVITEKKIACGVPTIYVKDTIKALGLLGKYHKGNTKVIGVTGSTGKTTVKDMIISVLGEKYSVTGTKGNNNNEIGVALTLLSIKKEEYCVIEMGMRAQGEIEWLSYISEPETSVITNSGTAHIGILGSKESIFLAKTEILKYTRKNAILPKEPRFDGLNLNRIKRIMVGKNGNYFADSIEHKERRICFKINYESFEINSIYEHNVNNATFAYAVGKEYGVEDDKIREGLRKWEISQNRGEVFFYKGIEIISDCYNANFESVKASIESMVKYSAGKKKMAVLLGDMLELGENADELHFKIGELCKKSAISKAFFLGRFSSSYAGGYGGGTILSDLNLVENEALSTIGEDYVLLIKASNSLNFERIIKNLKE